MKKYLLLLIITTLSLTSCGSEDESLDPIIGSWYAFSEDGEEFDECGKKNTVTFNEDNTFFSSSYYYDSQGECTTEGVDSAEWFAKEGSIYTIVEVEEDGERYEDDASIEFSDDNNTFTVERGFVYKRL